jgi:ribonuclease-3
MNHDRFSANPYNPNNVLISYEDVLHIFQKVNMNDFIPNNIELYQLAFKHKSYCLMKDYEEFVKPDNCLPLQVKSYETIEYLGDSLLGCMTAEYLFRRFKDQDEGFLTKIKTRIVNGEQLAYLAECLDLNKHLIISKHIEDNCDGRNNQHILEDSLESLIGALYQDTRDFTLVQEFVVNIIEEYLDLPEIIVRDTNYKDQILRYLQHNFKESPKYEHISNDTGNSDKMFECKLLHKGATICTGKGHTKKKSEQNAAYNALIHYNVITE